MTDSPTSKPLVDRLAEAMRWAMKHYRHDDNCHSSSFGSDGSRSCGCGKAQDRVRIQELFSEAEWIAIYSGKAIADEPSARLARATALLQEIQDEINFDDNKCPMLGDDVYEFLQGKDGAAQPPRALRDAAQAVVEAYESRFESGRNVQGQPIMLFGPIDDEIKALRIALPPETKKEAPYPVLFHDGRADETSARRAHVDLRVPGCDCAGCSVI